MIENLKALENITVVTMSNKSGEGIANVKETACNTLLEFRGQLQPDTLAGGNKLIKKV
jgi:nucleolar GTP-binding protein